MSYDTLTVDRQDAAWTRRATTPARKRLARRAARRLARQTLADWMLYE
jgi:hypothetical protein